MDRLENSIVAFILVKSSSQRLPSKNFLTINGIPLWLRTAKRAEAEPLINHIVIVAEDMRSFKIIEQGKQTLDRWDRFSILLRPPELCKPETTSEAVLLWAADIVDRLMDYEHILLLQATSPMLEFELLHKCIKSYLSDATLTNMVTVSPYTAREDGQIYLINRKLFRKARQLMTEELWVYNSIGSVPFGVIDIDFKESYLIAKAIIEGRSI